MKRYIKSGVTPSSDKRYEVISAKREPKQITELVLQGNYGYGWDDLTYYDDTPEGRKEMRADYKSYAENERIPLRTVRRKVDNPNYDAKIDPVYTKLANTYPDLINVIGNDDVVFKYQLNKLYKKYTPNIDDIAALYEQYNPASSSYAESITWQEYLDELRRAIRNKEEIFTADTIVGEIPVLFTTKNEQYFGEVQRTIKVFTPINA